jgi:hypothetical protein
MSEEYSRVVTIPYKEDGESGVLRMALGTYNYLFGTTKLPKGATYREFTVSPKSYVRHAWAGGPTIAVTRGLQTIKRAVMSASSTSKGSKRLILTSGETSETVYYTGKVYNAVAWLVENSKVNSKEVSIESARGTKYNVIGAKSVDL